MTRARRLRDDRGAATVEFALVFPIVAGLIAVVMFAGWLGAVKGILDHGTREAARYASIPCSDDLRTYPDDPETRDSAAGFDPATDPCPGSPEVAEVLEHATPMVAVDPANVAVTGGAPGRNAPVVVTVTYQAPNPFAWLMKPLTVLGVADVSSTITLTSRAEVRRE